MRLSIILPVLNEAAGIARMLAALQPLRDTGAEVIVVDGDSADATAQHAAPYADRVLQSARGRANQMNAGAAIATGDVLLFLHADTLLPPAADRLIAQGLAASQCAWGRFDVDIAGRPAMLKVIAFMMNWRSRITGIATGDQAIFVKRTDFLAIDGFPVQPLMEDTELSRRLKALSWPLCLRERVTTSGRRWETCGVWRTIVLMWSLRLRYWLGTPAEQLARAYR
jgi:rSAM/selenodomain-associated transferase 2